MQTSRYKNWCDLPVGMLFIGIVSRLKSRNISFWKSSSERSRDQHPSAEIRISSKFIFRFVSLNLIDLQKSRQVALVIISQLSSCCFVTVSGFNHVCSCNFSRISLDPCANNTEQQSARGVACSPTRSQTERIIIIIPDSVVSVSCRRSLCMRNCPGPCYSGFCRVFCPSTSR